MLIVVEAWVGGRHEPGYLGRTQGARRLGMEGARKSGKIRCQFIILEIRWEIRCQGKSGVSSSFWEIRCQFIILARKGKSGVEIRCQFIILARKDELTPGLILARKDEPTSRQEARERRIVTTVKPFAGTLRVTNPARKSRASSRKRVLRGGWVTTPAKRRQPDQTLCD